MATVQTLASFAIWIAYGVVLAKRFRHAACHGKLGNRNRATLRGALYLFIGLGILAIGVWAAQAMGGLRENAIDIPAWITITATGLVFVHLQGLAALEIARMAIRTVTARHAAPSEQEKPEGDNQ